MGGKSKNLEQSTIFWRPWWRWGLLVAILASVGLVASNLGVYRAGLQGRACFLNELDLVLTEELSPRYGSIEPGDLVVVRTRHRDKPEALARVLAVSGDRIQWTGKALQINGAVQNLPATPGQPVRRTVKRAKVAMMSALRRGVAGWKGGKRRTQKKPLPAGLGLEGAVQEIPRQHVYVTLSAGKASDRLLGKVSPLGDVVGKAWFVWKREDNVTRVDSGERGAYKDVSSRRKATRRGQRGR